MFRIAVIQNGVEMQHSGYVDAIPMYKNFGRIGKEKAEFTRFSGVNIRDLFSIGANYLLDFDTIILGTNATSDDDVYNVLRESSCKELLEQFISLGKGVLICSQKKYERKKDISDGTNKRVSNILPDHYEYCVDERPKNEDSKDEGASICNLDRGTLNQKCLLNLPNVIINDVIKQHCLTNSFQTHFYRDHILPIIDSAYQPIIYDKKSDVDVRNLVMVAVPQNKEKIVISTMALDWASHEELLENILNYLTRGVPHTAFVHKNNYDNKEMKIITMDAELSKIGNIEYLGIDKFLRNVEWHSLIVFSPDFSEQEVYEAWEKIKSCNPFTKAYHYRTVNSELVLVEYSNNAYIEQQKMDVLAWLYSKRGHNLWDNSLWKTFDVANLLYVTKPENYKTILSQIVEGITVRDDKNKEHYKNGNYDGVLAPTCGVLEILHWANENNKYNSTKDYLLNIFATLSPLNKMFVIRAFSRCSDSCVDALIKDFRLDNSVPLTDMMDLDLCLKAEIAMILCSNQDENINKRHMREAIEEICRRQLQNGRWDNLGNTAKILIFLLQEWSTIKTILDEPQDIELLKLIRSHIDRGITAIKTNYSQKLFNWENNIVTTANALMSLYLYDIESGYQSKDFLKNFVEESQIAYSYNALSLTLKTLDKAVDDLNHKTTELFESKNELRSLTERNTKIYNRLYVVASIAGFSLFGIISVFVLLAIKYFETFIGVISEVFMWVPVAIGLAISPLVVFFIKKISTISDNIKKRSKKNKHD